jgi:hypothetical protein
MPKSSQKTTKGASKQSKTTLHTLGTAGGRKVMTTSRVAKVVVEGIKEVTEKTQDTVERKRNLDTVSTNSGSLAHRNSKNRTDNLYNVVSPSGKATNDKEETMSEDPVAQVTVGLTGETVTVDDGHDIEEGQEKEEKETAVTAIAKKHEMLEKYVKDDTEGKEIVENTRANSTTNGKKSIEELNKNLKDNIIYEWPTKPKFNRTDLSKKITPVQWKKVKGFVTLHPMENTTDKCLMVAMAAFGNVWSETFPGETLNDKNVTTGKVKTLLTTVVKKKASDATRNELIKYATGFTKTSPEVFGPKAFDAKGNLSNSTEARFWLGMCEALGSTFELKDTIDMTAIIRQRKEEQKAQATRTLSFHPDTKGIGGEIHTSGAGIFLSQAGHRSKRPSKPVALPKKLQRKHQSFMKLVLPSNAPGVEKSEEACSNFRWAINRMIKHDPSLVVMVFPTQNAGTVKPIWRDVSGITGRDKLKPYSDRLWVGEGKRVWITIYIAHDVVQLSFMTSEIQSEFTEAGIELYVSNVQSAETTTAGYLIGSSSTMNQDHWTMLLSQNPKMKNIDIECRDQAIKIETTEKYNQKTEVRAMHIICSKEKLAQCRKALKGLYNKKRLGKEATRKLPEGRLMKWVPHAGTVDDIMPTRERKERFMNAKNIQRCFLSRNVVTIIHGVSDLDLPQKIRTNEDKVTLKQAIVCIKSITDLETPLFIGVDMKWNGDIVATSDVSLATEAQMIIAHLPLYLEHALGNKIWKWFLPDHRVFMEENFVYSDKDGIHRVIDRMKRRPEKKERRKVGDGDESMRSESTTSSIDSDDYAGGFAAESGAAKEAYEDAANFQPFEYLDDQDDNIEFNLALQITLDIPVDADGLIGDDNNSTDTFRTNCSAATAATTENKSATYQQDEHSIISDLTGNLTLQEPANKMSDIRPKNNNTTSETPDDRPQKKQDE